MQKKPESEAVLVYIVSSVQPEPYSEILSQNQAGSGVNLEIGS